MSSDLERKFETLWRQCGGQDLEREYKFHPEREWRFDFADPIAKIAIELEGGTWINGGHNRGKGYSKDCTKYNAAGVLGWRVFRYTTDMLDIDPYGHLRPLVELLGKTP